MPCINYSQVPVIEAAKQYLAKRLVPDATYRNWNAYSKEVGFEKGVNVMEAFSILPDPQTNGGLLIAVDPDAEEEIKNIFTQHGLESHITPIGKITEVNEKRIMVAV